MEYNTDIVTIVNELACFQVLKDVLLTPHQQKLAPIVAAEICQSREESESESENKKNSVGVEQSIQNLLVAQVASYVKETMSYKEAFDKLYEEKDSATDSNIDRRDLFTEAKQKNSEPNLLSIIHAQVDGFMKSRLKNFHPMWVSPSSQVQNISIDGLFSFKNLDGMANGVNHGVLPVDEQKLVKGKFKITSLDK